MGKRQEEHLHQVEGYPSDLMAQPDDNAFRGTFPMEVSVQRGHGLQENANLRENMI